jgi:adenosine deaminase/aminodeoxyfutalosine deaminase
MADFLLEMAKAELHLHLDGSVEPETLYERDPATPVEEFHALYEYANFDAFLRAFGDIGKRLRGPEDYALITHRLLQRLDAQNVRYAEIMIAAGVVLWKGQDFAPIFDAIRAVNLKFLRITRALCGVQAPPGFRRGRKCRTYVAEDEGVALGASIVMY